MTTAVITAAGSGVRMGGGTPKILLPLNGTPVVAWSVAAFAECRDVDAIVVVAHRDALETVRAIAEREAGGKLAAVVCGGSTRTASVRAGVAACPDGTDVVAVHDGARPCVSPAVISRTIAAARECGTGVAAARVVDTLKRAREEPDGSAVVETTVDRASLWAVQTPQTARIELLRRAFDAVADDDPAITDEASALEKSGVRVRLVPCPEPNPKITYPGDVALASALLRI